MLDKVGGYVWQGKARRTGKYASGELFQGFGGCRIQVVVTSLGLSAHFLARRLSVPRLEDPVCGGSMCSRIGLARRQEGQEVQGLVGGGILTESQCKHGLPIYQAEEHDGSSEGLP